MDVLEDSESRLRVQPPKSTLTI